MIKAHVAPPPPPEAAAAQLSPDKLISSSSAAFLWYYHMNPCPWAVGICFNKVWRAWHFRRWESLFRKRSPLFWSPLFIQMRCDPCRPYSSDSVSSPTSPPPHRRVAVEIKATELTAQRRLTLSFSTSSFVGFFFFPVAVDRKSAFNTFSYKTTCIWRGAAPLSHLLLTPQWAAIGANTVGRVRAEIALLSRAQFCSQTSASGWSSASADIRGNRGANHHWDQSNQSFFPVSSVLPQSRATANLRELKAEKEVIKRTAAYWEAS